MPRALLLCLLATGMVFAQTPRKVLFDHTGYQEAGSSAYWIIDDNEPDPSPSAPVGEQAWNGGISAWAFDLHQKGYVVRTLPAAGRVTYGDATNALDLKSFAVFVVPERYKRFTAAEMQALADYVRGGGGLYLMGNHAGAKRATSMDPNSTDAYTVFNEFFASSAGSGFGFALAGGHGPGDSSANTISNGFTTATGPIQDAIVRGTNGTLASMDFHSYAYVKLTGSNPAAVPILHTQVSGDDPATQLFLAAATVGQGRVVVIGDSAPSDDGTATTGGKSLHNSYSINSNRPFHLNAVDWLAGAPGNQVTASITTPSADLTVASGTTVAFAGTATDSSSTATLAYAWNFGDGATASGTNASHAFTNSGTANRTYTVAFTATDNTGASGSATRAVTVTPASTAKEILVNGGFESGTTAWSGTTSDLGAWSGQPAHGGARCAWICGNGSTATETLYQQVTIPSTATKATLSFWLHIDTAESGGTAYDTLLVRMLNSSGNVLKTLGSWSNVDAASGYVKKSFDVTTLKGQTVRIHFKGAEDYSLQTSFVVDDVSLAVQ